MKTYIITSSGDITEDTHAARIAQFQHLAEFTGDEWTRDTRERFAPRYVSEDVSDPEDIDDPTILEKPWTVLWDDRETNGEQCTVVARFATEKEADDFAVSENSRLLLAHIRDDGNFTLLHLPDDITASISGVLQGNYPNSRHVECRLTRGRTIAEAHANWSAHGVTDTWPRRHEILETLIDLIPDLIENTVNDALEDAAVTN